MSRFLRLKTGIHIQDRLGWNWLNRVVTCACTSVVEASRWPEVEFAEWKSSRVRHHHSPTSCGIYKDCCTSCIEPVRPCVLEHKPRRGTVRDESSDVSMSRSACKVKIVRKEVTVIGLEANWRWELLCRYERSYITLQYLLKITESSVAITLCQEHSTTPALPKKLRPSPLTARG